MAEAPNFHRHRTDIAPTTTLGRTIISPTRRKQAPNKRKGRSRKRSRNKYASPKKGRNNYYRDNGENHHELNEKEAYVTQSEFKMYFQRMLTEIHASFEQQNERLTEVEMLTVNMYHRIEKLATSVKQMEKKTIGAGNPEEENGWEEMENEGEDTPIEKKHMRDPQTPFLSPLTFASENKRNQSSKAFQQKLEEIESNMNTPRTPKESDKYESMVNDLKSEFSKPLSASPSITSSIDDLENAEEEERVQRTPENGTTKEEEGNKEQPTNMTKETTPKQGNTLESHDHDNESDISSTYPLETSPLNNNYLKALEAMDDEEDSDTPLDDSDVFDSPDKAAPSVTETNEGEEEGEFMKNHLQEEVETHGKEEEETHGEEEEVEVELTKTPLQEIDTSYHEHLNNPADISPSDLDTMTLMTDISIDEERHPRNVTPVPSLANDEIPFNTTHSRSESVTIEEQTIHEEGDDDVSDTSMVYNEADTSEGSIYMRSEHEENENAPPVGQKQENTSAREEDPEESLKSEAERQRDMYRETFVNNSMGSIHLTEYERYIYSENEDQSGSVSKQTLKICPALTRMITSVLLTFGNLSTLSSLSVKHSFRDITINAVINSDIYIMDAETALESFSRGHNTNRWLDWMLFNLCSRKFCFKYKDSTGTSYVITWNDFLNPEITDHVEGDLPLSDDVWCEYEFYFIPHFLTLFGLPSLTQDHRELSHSILVEVAAVSDINTIISYNGEPLPAQNLKQYAEYYWGVKKCQSLEVSKNFQVVIGSCDEEANPDPISFVNAHLTVKGGSHVRHVRRCLNRAAISKESRLQLKRSQHSKYPDVIDHIQIFASVNLDNPILNDDSSKLSKLPKSVGRISEKQALQLLRNLGLNLPISIDSLF